MRHPSLGRFTRRDPKGYIDGMNLYQAVGGNPAAALDPMGTGPIERGFRGATPGELLKHVPRAVYTQTLSSPPPPPQWLKTLRIEQPQGGTGPGNYRYDQYKILELKQKIADAELLWNATEDQNERTRLDDVILGYHRAIGKWKTQLTYNLEHDAAVIGYVVSLHHDGLTQYGTPPETGIHADNHRNYSPQSYELSKPSLNYLFDASFSAYGLGVTPEEHAEALLGHPTVLAEAPDAYPP